MTKGGRGVRRVGLVLAVGFVLVALVAASGAWLVWRDYLFEVEGYDIPGPEPVLTDVRRAPTSPAPVGAPPYATAVDGTHFVDQHGTPYLVRGDSPWAIVSQLTLSEADAYWATRQDQGFNAAIMLAIGSREGSGSWSGATPDGIRPFTGDRIVFNGDVTRPNPTYLSRMHDVIASAATHGITVFLYAADTWSMGRTFRPASQQACADYGAALATALADLPNIVWVLGGDFVLHAEPTAVDRCYDAVRQGIRATGDHRPLSIQFTSPLTWSTQNTFWSDRVDWNFLYSYAPPYQGARAASARTPSMPVILGESNYEGMNLEPGTPTTTHESLRRQAAWALTSGAVGDFWGNDDWSFPSGWQDRDWPGQHDVNVIRDVVASVDWWTLHPAADGEVFQRPDGPPASTDIQRDVLDDDEPTAAASADGRLALLYLPTTVTVRLAAAYQGSTLEWIDPTTGTRTPATGFPAVTPPGANAGGDGDWLLLVTRS